MQLHCNRMTDALLQARKVEFVDAIDYRRVHSGSHVRLPHHGEAAVHQRNLQRRIVGFEPVRPGAHQPQQTQYLALQLRDRAHRERDRRF